MSDRDDYKKIKRIQIAVYDAAHSTGIRDHALISFALMELAIVISIGTRHPHRTKLEHRDNMLEAVGEIHDDMWDHTSDLFEDVQKAIREG